MQLFDLTLANPPYGKQCSVCKPITKNILNYTKDLTILTPKNIILDKTILENIYNSVDVSEQVSDFDKITLANLYIFQLTQNNNNNVNFEDIVFTKKQLELYNKISQYNTAHPSHMILIDGTDLGNKWNKTLNESTRLSKSEIFSTEILNTQLKTLVENQQVFVKTIWAANDGVHFEDCYDFQYNFENKYDLKWNQGKHLIDLFVFVNKQERDNFRDWWYSCNEKRTSKKERIGLTNACLDLIVAAGKTGVGYYEKYFPNLDWSEKWTDENIYKELNLNSN